MARPRKNAAKVQGSLLAPDEVAEIPVEEQPYPLPEGWRWVRLGNVLSASKEKTEDFSSLSLRYIGLEHFEKDNGITGFASAEGVRSLKNIFHPGQILYGKLRPYLNKHDIANFDGVCSTDILVFDCLSRANSKFINYFFNLGYFQEYAIANSNGINLPRVSEKVILDAVFPLPPFDEQQRIVDRIESLFARLDEAKSKAEAVLDGFEIRKAAILHKAFTGELTERWREENKIQISSWKEESITSLCHSLKYGTAKKSKEIGSTVVLRMGNLQDGEIDWSNLAYSDDQDDIQKYLLFPNDVLFNRTNSSELVGKTAIYRGECPAIYAGYLIKMNYKKNRLTGPYLNYVMNSHKAKEYCNNVKSDGVNQSNINAKKLGAFVISVPSLPEQQEIVRILDNLLAKERHIREAAENVLSQIGLMKKAILARAFRGEVGTHGSARDTLQNNGSM